MSQYNATSITITSEATPDPWVVQANGKYFMTFTAGDRLEIWRANQLDYFRNPEKCIVWRPPPDTPYSEGLWAPELHQLGGRWYIYFAAAQPGRGNPSHRMWVCGGPPADADPCDPQGWEFLGGIKGMPDNWAIDGTVFSLNNQYYTVWSGWPENDNSDKKQYLWIMALADPITGSSPPVVISKPEHKWEFSDGDHGVNEGPQWLESPNGNWKGVVYSCAGSWTKDYKLAMLTYKGGDPLNPHSWHKEKHPMLENAGQKGDQGPFGPGHCSFLPLSGGEYVCCFHGTDSQTDGWENRKCRAQRLAWTNDGPYMGTMVGPHVEDFNQFMTGPPPPGATGPQQTKPHGLKGLLHKLKEEL